MSMQGGQGFHPQLNSSPSYSNFPNLPPHHNQSFHPVHHHHQPSPPLPHHQPGVGGPGPGPSPNHLQLQHQLPMHLPHQSQQSQPFQFDHNRPAHFQHHLMMNDQHSHPQFQPPVPTLPQNQHQSFFYPHNPNVYHHPPPQDPNQHQHQHPLPPYHHSQAPHPHQMPQNQPVAGRKRSGASDQSTTERKKAKVTPKLEKASDPSLPSGLGGTENQGTVTVFQCAGYGDCQMTFTRSEHLARHIRKHTGERPFNCHCGKAFSRLDNLRQHANTVHVDQPAENETTLARLSALHAQLAASAAQSQHAHTTVMPRAAADALVQASAEASGRKRKPVTAKKQPATPKQERKKGPAPQRKSSGATSLGDSSSSRRPSNNQQSTPMSHPEEHYSYAGSVTGAGEEHYPSPYNGHPPSWHASHPTESYYGTPREHGSGSGSGGVPSFRNSYDSNGGPSALPAYFHPSSDSHSQNQGAGPYYAYDTQSHSSLPQHQLQHHFSQSQYEHQHQQHSHSRPPPDQYPPSPGYDQYSSNNPDGPPGHHQYNQSHPLQSALTSRYGNPNDATQSSGRDDTMEFSESYYPPQNSHYATPGSGSGSGASPSGSFAAGSQQPSSSSFQSTLSAHLQMRTPTMSRKSLPLKDSPPPPSSILANSPDLPLPGHDRPILPPLASISRPGTAGGGVSTSASSFSLLAAAGNEDRRPSIGLGSLGLGSIGRGSIDGARVSFDAGSSQGAGGQVLPSIGAHLSASDGEAGDRRPFSSPAVRPNGPGLAPISLEVADSSGSSLPESLRSSSISGVSGSAARLRGNMADSSSSGVGAGVAKLGESGGSRPNTTGGSKPGSSVLASMAATVNERLSRPTSSSRLTAISHFEEGMKAPQISAVRTEGNQTDVKVSPPSSSSPFMFQPPPLPGLNGVSWNTASPFGNGSAARRPSSSKLNGGGFLTRRRGSEDLGRLGTVEDGKPRPGSSSAAGTPRDDDMNGNDLLRSRPLTSGDSSIPSKFGNSSRSISSRQGIKREDEDEDDFFPPPPSGAGLDSRRVSIASLMNDDRENQGHSGRLSISGITGWTNSTSRPGTSSNFNSFSFSSSLNHLGNREKKSSDSIPTMAELEREREREEVESANGRRNSSAPPVPVLADHKKELNHEDSDSQQSSSNSQEPAAQELDPLQAEEKSA